MELKTSAYHIIYDPNTATILCQGSLSLNGTQEYLPLFELLKKATDTTSQRLTLDLRQLEFLNSSGINTMTKFIINARNKPTLQVEVIGHQEILWQVRLLKNFQRLMPNLIMKLE